jgi:hypothetical protein
MRKQVAVRRGIVLALCASGFMTLPSCQTQASELRGLADRAPLDYAVLVTGGAWLQPAEAGATGTFGGYGGGPQSEPLAIGEIVGALREGSVFRRVEADRDEHRASLRDQLASRRSPPELLQFLQESRDRGFDLLLVVEGLQDDAIERQGVNGRWPVTFLTWFLLGIGAFIPDHTFESGVTLRVSLRDLQTGAVLADAISSAGPIDLSLVERSSATGIVSSILVPPFWVPDDDARVSEEVRGFTQRRLLVALARELKSEPMRLRLRRSSVAAISWTREGTVLVESTEALREARLRRADGAAAQGGDDFARALLGSLRRDGDRFVYEAPLPPDAAQILIATIAGNVASATFRQEGAR